MAPVSINRMGPAQTLHPHDDRLSSQLSCVTTVVYVREQVATPVASHAWHRAAGDDRVLVAAVDAQLSTESLDLDAWWTAERVPERAANVDAEPLAAVRLAALDTDEVGRWSARSGCALSRCEAVASRSGLLLGLDAGEVLLLVGELAELLGYASPGRRRGPAAEQV